MRVKEIDKMTCENKHQSMERNGKEISSQNETSLPPNERYRRNTIRTPLIATSHSHTPTPLTSVPLGSCSCTVTWAVGYCTTSFRTFLKRKKQRQTYIFAAKANYQRSKHSATHDKQPYGGVLLSKTITAPLPPFKQKEKHKRLKAATQRTNPAWSSCYDGSQLSAAAMGKWTPKWRKKGTNTKPFMQMSSPFAVR